MVADALSRPPIKQFQPDINCVSSSSAAPALAGNPQRLPGLKGVEQNRLSSSSAAPAIAGNPQRLPGSKGVEQYQLSTPTASSASPSQPPSHLDPQEWPPLQLPSRRQQDAPAPSSLHSAASSTSFPVVDSRTAPDASSTPSTSSSTSLPTSAASSASSGPPETPFDEGFEVFVNAVEAQSLDLVQMAREQPLDRDCQEASQDPQSNFRVKTVDLGTAKLLVDTSTGKPRPLVPYSWRRRVFDVVHGLGHPGVERTRQAVTNRFVWPNVRHDTSKWARECLSCQRSKVIRHTVPPIGEFIVPQKRFEHINLDLVTLPLSNGYKYLLTIVDRLSRWPQAIPIPDMTTETVADAFAHGWVATFGVPATITTDRGSQFGTAIWTQLMATWGIKSITTTAYHPEANGMVERFHRRLKEALLALGADAGDKWYWRLPLVLLAIRTTVKPDIGATPADLVFGEGVAVPGCLLSSTPSSDEDTRQQSRHTLANLRMEVERLQPTQTSAHRIQRVQLPPDLRTASHVFIKRGGITGCLETPYTGPFRVMERQPTYFKVSIPGRGVESVALARIKPACVAPLDEDDPLPPPPVTPPTPPPRGRPPGSFRRFPSPSDRRTRHATSSQRQTHSGRRPPSKEASEAPTPSSESEDPTSTSRDVGPLPSMAETEEALPLPPSPLPQMAETEEALPLPPSPSPPPPDDGGTLCQPRRRGVRHIAEYGPPPPLPPPPSSNPSSTRGKRGRPPSRPRDSEGRFIPRQSQSTNSRPSYSAPLRAILKSHLQDFSDI